MIDVLYPDFRLFSVASATPPHRPAEPCLARSTRDFFIRSFPFGVPTYLAIIGRRQGHQYLLTVAGDLVFVLRLY